MFSIILGVWFRTVAYLFLGFCLYEEYAVNARSSAARCGDVFITINSLNGSYIELNWETNCYDYQVKKIALYNADIRDKTKQVLLYSEVLARDHPKGYYLTKIPFNISCWPEQWNYNSTSRAPKSANLPYWIVSYSENDKIIDIQSLRLQATWMNDNRKELNSQRIGDLLIPGTHDSGCYGPIELFENYVSTQDKSVWQQLVFGIRYLDLRVAYYDDGEFWINHGVVKVKKIQTIYDQIKKFVLKSPGEIIIVDIHRFAYPKSWSRDLHEKFIKYTLNELGKFLLSKNENYAVKGPTMEEIWTSGKNIILAYGEPSYTEVYPQLWNPITQAWADTNYVELLHSFLGHFLYSNHRNITFYAVMAELTPQVIDVITGKNSLRKLANDVNPQLTGWVRVEWHQLVNIVASDFFLGNNLINVAIDYNKKSVANSIDSTNNKLYQI